MNNKKLLNLIPYKITIRKKIIVSSLKAMKEYFQDGLWKTDHNIKKSKDIMSVIIKVGPHKDRSPWV